MGTVNYQQTPHQIFVVSRPSSQDGATIQHFQAAPIIISPSQPTTTTNFHGTTSTSSASLKVLNTHQLSTSQPRLHPKKRKFNPAELEEMEPTTTATTTTSSSSSSSHNRNGGSSVSNEWTPEKQQPPRIDTQSAEPVVQQKRANNYITNTQASLTSVDSPMETLDLSEWCNQRVLAKQNDYYATGVTRPSSGSSSIVVEFDYPEGSLKVFHDVFGSGRYDVISDASPPVNDVSPIRHSRSIQTVKCNFFFGSAISDFAWLSCLHTDRIDESHGDLCGGCHHANPERHETVFCTNIG